MKIENSKRQQEAAKRHKLMYQISRDTTSEGQTSKLWSRNLGTWTGEKIIGDCEDDTNLNTILSQNICKALDECSVAKFPDQRKRGEKLNSQVQQAVDKLNRERVKLDKLIVNKNLRGGDRTRFETRIVVINTEISRLYSDEKTRLEKRALDNIAGDARSFYKYANSFKKSRVKIGPLKSGSTFTSGEKEMADILGKQYQSVFTTPNDGSYIFNRFECRDIMDVNLSPEQFETAMKSMKASSAPGPDGIPAFLLKTFAKPLSVPLHILCWRCLESGKMPEGKITANITPIFKSKLPTSVPHKPYH